MTLTSATGTAEDANAYHAFGDAESATGTQENPFRYGGEVGYYRDAADRLYVRARYYRPDLGLWLSADPVATEPPYLYVHNAPATLVDPAGTEGYLLYQGTSASSSGSGNLVSANVTRPQDLPASSVASAPGNPYDLSQLYRALGLGQQGPSLFAAPGNGTPPGPPVGLAYPGMFSAPSVQYVHTNDEGFLTAPTAPAPNFPSVALPQPSVPSGQSLLAAGMKPGSGCNPAQEDWCARTVTGLVDLQARYGLTPSATMVLMPEFAVLKALNQMIMPHALAALAHAFHQPTATTSMQSAMQTVQQFEQLDAAFGRGMEEGFLTEFCETFNVVGMVSGITDIFQCFGEFARMGPGQTLPFLQQQVFGPLGQLWDQTWKSFGQMTVEQKAHEMGKVTGTVLFHVLVMLILGLFTGGTTAEADAAVLALRAARLPRAVQLALRGVQGAQKLRFLSAGHDPNHPCVGLALALGGHLAGEAAGAGLKRVAGGIQAAQAAREAEVVAGSSKGLTQPIEPPSPAPEPEPPRILVPGDIDSPVTPAEEPPTVYRGERSSRNPETVFESGIPAKGTNKDLLRHVSANQPDTYYVSTSLLQRIAMQFAGKNGWLYVIRTSRGIDVNVVLGEASPFPEQMEIAVPGGVNPDEIVGAYPMRNGKISGEFRENLGFNK